MNKIKSKILVSAIIITLTLGNVTNVYASKTFELDGPEDLEFGCINTYNNLLYVSGIVAKVDPVLLKTIMCKESGGNPSISKNSNGTFDSGIMQINDVSSKGYSKEDRNNNAALNVWLATEVIKGKASTVKSIVGSTAKLETVKEDSFSVIWLYNGHSSDNIESYAIPVNNEYMDNTNLSSVVRGLTTDRNYRAIPISSFLPPKSMAEKGTSKYEDFYMQLNSKYNDYIGMSFEEEDFSDMSIPSIDNNYTRPNSIGSLISSYKSSMRYSDVAQGTDYRTEVVGTGEHNQKIDYKSYKLTRAIIKAVFTVVAVLVYGLIIFMVITWVLYLFYFLGIHKVNSIMKKITRGKLDCSDEDIIKDLLIVTAVVSVSVALVLTGFLQSIVTYVVIHIMTII